LGQDASHIFDFCAHIVDATHDLVCAFKPQIAYFAAHRAEAQLERLIAHIRNVAPRVPIILDAKRGDIGSTAEQYAIEAFERYGADAVTLSPFMGFDSVAPYLKYHGKGAFLLCRTSNPGGDDLQNQRLASVEGQPLLYEHVARLAQGPWNLNGQLGLVVGATYPAEIERVRQNGFTPEEVARGKEGYLQSRKLARAADSALASKLATDLYFGRTYAWDAAFEQRVAALTAAEITAAFVKHIDPRRLNLAKAGDFRQ
jgi:orotidine 5'-phosphate decarboxylase subfamily 2